MSIYNRTGSKSHLRFYYFPEERPFDKLPMVTGNKLFYCSPEEQKSKPITDKYQQYCRPEDVKCDGTHEPSENKMSHRLESTDFLNIREQREQINMVEYGGIKQDETKDDSCTSFIVAEDSSVELCLPNSNENEQCDSEIESIIITQRLYAEQCEPLGFETVRFDDEGNDFNQYKESESVDSIVISTCSSCSSLSDAENTDGYSSGADDVFEPVNNVQALIKGIESSIVQPCNQKYRKFESTDTFLVSSFSCSSISSEEDGDEYELFEDDKEYKNDGLKCSRKLNRQNALRKFDKVKFKLSKPEVIRKAIIKNQICKIIDNKTFKNSESEDDNFIKRVARFSSSRSDSDANMGINESSYSTDDNSNTDIIIDEKINKISENVCTEEGIVFVHNDHVDAKGYNEMGIDDDDDLFIRNNLLHEDIETINIDNNINGEKNDINQGYIEQKVDKDCGYKQYLFDKFINVNKNKIYEEICVEINIGEEEDYNNDNKHQTGTVLKDQSNGLNEDIHIENNPNPLKSLPNNKDIPIENDEFKEDNNKIKEWIAEKLVHFKSIEIDRDGYVQMQVNVTDGKTSSKPNKETIYTNKEIGGNMFSENNVLDRKSDNIDNMHDVADEINADHHTVVNLIKEYVRHIIEGVMREYNEINGRHLIAEDMCDKKDNINGTLDIDKDKDAYAKKTLTNNKADKAIYGIDGDECMKVNAINEHIRNLNDHLIYADDNKEITDDKNVINEVGCVNGNVIEHIGIKTDIYEENSINEVMSVKHNEIVENIPATIENNIIDELIMFKNIGIKKDVYVKNNFIDEVICTLINKDIIGSNVLADVDDNIIEDLIDFKNIKLNTDVYVENHLFDDEETNIKGNNNVDEEYIDTELIIDSKSNAIIDSVNIEPITVNAVNEYVQNIINDVVQLKYNGINDTKNNKTLVNDEGKDCKHNEINKATYYENCLIDIHKDGGNCGNDEDGEYLYVKNIDTGKLIDIKDIRLEKGLYIPDIVGDDAKNIDDENNEHVKGVVTVHFKDIKFNKGKFENRLSANDMDDVSNQKGEINEHFINIDSEERIDVDNIKRDKYDYATPDIIKHDIENSDNQTDKDDGHYYINNTDGIHSHNDGNVTNFDISHLTNEDNQHLHIKCTDAGIKCVEQKGNQIITNICNETNGTDDDIYGLKEDTSIGVEKLYHRSIDTEDFTEFEDIEGDLSNEHILIDKDIKNVSNKDSNDVYVKNNILEEDIKVEKNEISQEVGTDNNGFGEKNPLIQQNSNATKPMVFQFTEPSLNTDKSPFSDATIMKPMNLRSSTSQPKVDLNKTFLQTFYNCVEDTIRQQEVIDKAMKKHRVIANTSTEEGRSGASTPTLGSDELVESFNRRTVGIL